MIVSWLNRGGLIRLVRRDLPAVTLVLAALLGAFFAASLSGCGASVAAQHRRLNHLTSVADPTYGEAVELCDTLRDRVVDREGTSYREDRRDMDQIHAVCDPMVEGFETLRGSQLTARRAIDDGGSAAVSEALRQALELWPHVQELYERIQERSARDDE